MCANRETNFIVSHYLHVVVAELSAIDALLFFARNLCRSNISSLIFCRPQTLLAAIFEHRRLQHSSLDHTYTVGNLPQ